MIKGQEELYNKIDSLKYLPHSILLVGEVGSGKHEICEYISDRFNLSLFDLTECISNEFIDDIYQTQIKSLYVIDVQKISVREQNILLKFYEEPSEYTYIILKTTSENSVLDTILSRSYILKMKIFSREYLSSLVQSGDSSFILGVCTTPGQIEVANHTDMNMLRSLCKNILTKLDIAPFYNVMSIANKINFSDEYNKFDLMLFIKVLSYECLLSDTKNSLSIYLKLNELNKYIWSMNNKKQYFEHFLVNIYGH